MALEIYTTYNDIPFVLLAPNEEQFFETFKENVKIAKWEDEIVNGLWKNCNRVYQYNTVENTFTLVGYYIFKLESAPTLIGKSQLKKYEGAFIVYDGSLGPKEYMDDLPVEQLGRINPVPEDQRTMSSPTGTVVCSGFNVPGNPQNVFYPFPTDALSFDTKEQWFCSSRNLKEPQYIGYVFSDGRKFNLNAVHILARVGTVDNPAISVPTPKIVRIEGFSEDGEWEAITSDLEIANWQFMTPNSFDFGDKVTAEHTGYRLVIVEWNPGADSDMFPGLFKLKFICTPTNLVKVPKIPCPDSNYKYAKHNLSLLHKDLKETPLKDHPRVIGYNKEEVVRIVKEILSNEYDDTVNIAYEQIVDIVKTIVTELYTNPESEQFKELESSIKNKVSSSEVAVDTSTIQELIKNEVSSKISEFKDTITEEVNTAMTEASKKMKMPSYDSFVMGIVSKYKIDKFPAFTETIDKFVTLGKALTNVQDRNREELLRITSSIKHLDDKYIELSEKIANNTNNENSSPLNAHEYVARKAFENEVNKLNAKIRNAKLDVNAVEDLKDIKEKFENFTSNVNTSIDEINKEFGTFAVNIDECNQNNKKLKEEVTKLLSEFKSTVDGTIAGYNSYLEQTKNSFENKNLDTAEDFTEFNNKLILLDGKLNEVISSIDEKISEVREASYKMYDGVNTTFKNHLVTVHESVLIDNERHEYTIDSNGDIYVCTGDKSVNFVCDKLTKKVCVRITLMDNSVCPFTAINGTMFEFTQYPDDSGKYVQSDAFDANKVGMQVYLTYNPGTNIWTVISKN